VCKAFFTDKGFDVCVIGQQVFGGHGYIREYGQEQLVRDTRIAQIYEGTNGIQALDLTARKVIGTRGQLVDDFTGEIRRWIAQQVSPQMTEFVRPLEVEVSRLEKVTADLLLRSHSDANAAGSASVEYLQLFGCVTYAWLWARIAAVALNNNDGYYVAKLATARFFFAHLLPQTKALGESISRGSDALMQLSAELF
jgi:hypothetical protein